jgi:hypothetical protein
MPSPSPHTPVPAAFAPPPFNTPFSTPIGFLTLASPVNPTPSHFNSSSLTPTPTPRHTLPIKRGRTHQLPETPAKRIKPTHRQTITRSTSKDALVTQTGDDIGMDLFTDDPENLVRPIILTGSPFLISTCADQGGHRNVGPRPLKNSCRISHDLCLLTDQPGHVSVANSFSCKIPCRSTSTKSLPPLLYWILTTLIVLLCINATSATSTPAASLSLYALNTNGFVHPTKIDATNRSISHRNPDIFVITETKTNSSCSSKMSYTDYQIFEEKGTPVIGHHLYKWGVILGIKKGITVSQRVPITHPALVGRMIVVDIVIPLDNGLGFTHRVIAAYAPWNVTDTTETSAFWSEAAKLCLATPNSWTLLSDLNATVTQAERKSGGTDARLHFNNFLHLSKGSDLWSSCPERSRLTDWTCKPRQTTDGGSIIDRIVTSAGCFLDSEIYVADGHLDYVPMTDHRAIIGRIILKPPERNSSRCVHDLHAPVLNNPRIRFPNYKDKHLFQTYRDQTDIEIKDAGLHERRVTDDLSFNSLYHDLTNVINDTAVKVFGRVTRRRPEVHKTITNPIIQQLQARSRAIGGALRLVKYPTYSASHAVTRTHCLLSLEYTLCNSNHSSLRSYLIAKRKLVNKDLYPTLKPIPQHAASAA